MICLPRDTLVSTAPSRFRVARLKPRTSTLFSESTMTATMLVWPTYPSQGAARLLSSSRENTLPTKSYQKRQWTSVLSIWNLNSRMKEEK
ncbi:hypothetical protein GCK32_021012 [Trichostrongylus colubriformis]|uniref:Uncharacterized protein n=1 Tax=Trichostrongylus colubriformis TaxID=6319 RepID=A0AAN8EWX0_TRICO